MHPQGQIHEGPFQTEDYHADLFAGGPGIRERHENSPFDDRNYHPDMFASGPGDSGPGIGMAIGVGVGAVAVIATAMYFLGGREAPKVPSLGEVTEMAKRETIPW